METLVIENQIGVAKGTDVEKEVMDNFRGETAEVGLYLAMGRQAEREGYPEVARALKDIAWEEANHAAQFAELNGLITPNTKENIERMLKGERMANKGKQEASIKAAQCGLTSCQIFFGESAMDEGRHARALEGLLKRYF
ncbi:MAG: rubrerythrin family protein [Deltaproteobacteria bacterium]|nr:rubrerythrin family protein [Deltaproteobacteria bacterium]